MHKKKKKKKSEHDKQFASDSLRSDTLSLLQLRIIADLYIKLM